MRSFLQQCDSWCVHSHQAFHFPMHFKFFHYTACIHASNHCNYFHSWPFIWKSETKGERAFCIFCTPESSACWFYVHNVTCSPPFVEHTSCCQDVSERKSEASRRRLVQRSESAAIQSECERNDNALLRPLPVTRCHDAASKRSTIVGDLYGDVDRMTSQRTAQDSPTRVLAA